MTYICRASDLADRPVVTLDTAAEAGRIADLVVDPGNGDVVGFTLRKQGLLGLGDGGGLPLAAVRAVGPDAVMITASTGIVGGDQMPQGLTCGRDLKGDTVVTQEGTESGRVTDVIVRIDRAKVDVIGYEVETAKGATSLVPLPDTFAISSDALIVSKEMRLLPAGDLEAFGAAVDQMRASGSR